MRETLSKLISIALLSVVFLTPNSYAHSDTEKARFVAQSGTDTGECNNRFRPCKSIAYAVVQANKGDSILVAEGSYIVDSDEAIVYLVSNTHPIYGGYNVSDSYQNQSPNQFKSTLVGVPSQYAEALYKKGFHVISDSKANFSGEYNTDENSGNNAAINSRNIEQGLQSLLLMQNAQTSAACVDGSAAGFTCNKVSLVGRLPLGALPTNSSSANDIWGHIDLNDMREYAIIGLQRGVVVVDVSVPNTPIVVGSIAGQSTTWRDIKVFQYYNPVARRFDAYAYASADNVTEGLSIIDLRNLPNSIALVERNTVDREAHNVYISNVDYTTNSALNRQQALLHLTGTNNLGGAWRTYSLVTPGSPEAAYANSSAQRSDYTHDASSILIDDERANSCGLVDASVCNLIIDFNEREVRLWQHNSPNQASQLSEFTYPNVEYVHSGWWSEDKHYIFVHDELDERTFALNTTLNVFDISDLRAPQLVATWRGPTRAIDHNGFVKGNKYYMSTYERGLTILDVGNPRAPVEVGFFDTFGASNNASFNGMWGVYPYLPSGNILASDIQGGLYIFQDNTLLPEHNGAGFAHTQVIAQEGIQATLEVVKQGNTGMTIDYQILHTSGGEQDIAEASGTLVWLANENQSQFITLDIFADTLDEFDELFVVVLNNPKDGDVIMGKSHAFVTIEGSAINTGTLSFEAATVSVLETQGRVVVTINRQNGSEGDIVATVNMNEGSARNPQDFAFIDNTSNKVLTWTDGDTRSQVIEIAIVDDNERESPEAFTISFDTTNPLSVGSISELTIVIKDDDANSAPIVNAGVDIQVNTRQTVLLENASAIDTDGELIVQWSQVAGPAVTVNNEGILRPTFVAPSAAATLTFQLRATDEFGLSSTDTINVRVIAPVNNSPGAQSGASGGGIAVFYLLLLSLFVWARKAS